MKKRREEEITLTAHLPCQVNYLEWEGKILPESAWCSIPFNEVAQQY